MWHYAACIPMDILYLDPHVVVMNKPSGLLVHRGLAQDADTALFRVRDTLGQYVYPVHRLDRGTSGALLFGRSREAAALLGAALSRGEFEKRYLALVRGTPPASGVIDYPIPKAEGGERVAALTRFRLLKASSIDRCSLIEAEPETGRLHQIRLHLRHLSHPLIGDVKHGRGDINRRYRALYHLHRLALHAHRVSFPSPESGERIVVRAPLPADLADPFAALDVGDEARTAAA